MRARLTKTIATAAAVLGSAAVAVAFQQAPAPEPAPARATAGTTAAPLAVAFQPRTPAEKAVVDRVAEFSKAYGGGDAAALAALYADDAVIVAPDGLEVRGKERIGRMYADSFADGRGLKLETRVESVRFLTPDVARVEGRSRLSAADGDAADYLRFTALLVGKDGAWSIAELRESPAPAEDVEPYQRLKDLEWMVGRWVDEDERHKVDAEVEWAANRAYLLRTQAVELDGRPSFSTTMFIGWDPQTGQIKSWAFDSEGGRSEGTWTRVGEEQWVVKSFGVLRDGLPNSSTQIHTILTKDSVRTDVVDRIVGGRIEDDVVDLILVRKPPSPGGAGEAPAAK